MNNKGKYVEIIDDGSLQIYGVVRKGLTSGIGLDFKWEGTKLGVKREDQAEYEYVDLKADNALELTKESIIETLGYTPANIDDLIIHMTDLDIHVTEEEKQLITTIENKADKTYVDTINTDLINRIKVLSDNHDAELKIINDNLTTLDNNKLDIERYNMDQEDINNKLLTIPRKTSDLMNDSDFVNSESPIFIGIQRQIDNLGISKVDQNLFTLEIRRLEDMIAEIDTSGGVDLSEIKSDIEDLKINKADIAYVDQKVADIHDKFMELLDLKVDKVIGKGLSTNDYTDDDKLKLASLTSIQKISDLEQDIPYLLSKDLDTIKQDISNNTTLINQEIARLEAKIDDIDIPDDEITAIKLSIQNLEQLKADKSYVVDEVNRLEVLINDLDPPEIDLSEIKADVQNLKDTKADLSYVNSEIATVNEKIDDIVIPPEVDLTDINSNIDMLKESKADKTAIPTKLSELSNDTGFITIQDVPETDLSGVTESIELNNQEISELKTGKANKADIPTKLGQLTNDKGYITLAQVPETDLTGVNASISNLENIKADKTEIPTKVSSLENDSGFITSSAIPTSLPANGGNADTVGGFTVGVNVPANAKFTDTNTTYSEITTSEIDIGTATTLRTITGRRVQYILDKVGTMISTAISALNKSSIGLGNVDNTSDANKPISVATQKALDTKADKVDVTASLELKANKTDVPTKLSELNNDSGFITQSSVPTKISNLTDDTSTKPIQFTERVQIKDTRSTNDTPLDIMKSGKASLKFDFKSRSSVGNPPAEISASASYAHILTVYGWTDSSGGYPTQISFGKDKVGIRTGISNTAWSGWRIYSDDTVLNNIMKSYVDGEISALDSKKANKSDILSPYHLGSNPPTNTSVIWVKNKE